MKEDKGIGFVLVADKDSVNITSKHNKFNYQNFHNMYAGTLDGHGLQCIEPNGENPRLLKLCGKISKLIYKYLESEKNDQKHKI